MSRILAGEGSIGHVLGIAFTGVAAVLHQAFCSDDSSGSGAGSGTRASAGAEADGARVPAIPWSVPTSASEDAEELATLCDRQYEADLATCQFRGATIRKFGSRKRA